MLVADMLQDSCSRELLKGYSIPVRFGSSWYFSLGSTLHTLNYNGSEDPKLRLNMACLWIILSLSWMSDSICYKRGVSVRQRRAKGEVAMGEGGFLQMSLKE